MSEEYSRIAQVALFTLVFGALIGSVFLSPTLVLGMVFGVVAVFITFARPTWSLAFLLFYLPFESFLLKWVPDDIYLYARYFSEVLIYLLAVSVLWMLITGVRSAKSTPIDIPFIIFVVLLLASTVINLTPPMTAILGIRQILRFVFLFFITAYLAPSKDWIKKVLIILMAILAIQMSLGFMQAAFGETVDSFLLPSERRTFGEIQLTSGTVQFWDPGQRVFGTLGRYDRLGTFMAFFMLIISAILYETKALEKYRKYLPWLLALSVPALALTYSRSAWFGFVLGFLFLALWAYRDRRVALGAGTILIAMTLYLSVSGLVVNRLIDVSDQNLTERFFEAFSFERWRGEYYGLGRMFWIVQTPSVVLSSPVFGHGPASYGGGAVAALRNTKVYDNSGLPFGVYGTEGYIDNNWFSLWGETGTLGFASYLWIFGALFVMCIRAFRRSEDPFTRALAIGVASAMIAVVLNAFLATFLEVRTLATYLWVFTALVFVLGEREKLLN